MNLEIYEQSKILNISNDVNNIHLHINETPKILELSERVIELTILEDVVKTIELTGGRQGTPGQKGDQGEQGEQGPQGIVDYDLVVKLDQSTPQSIVNGIPLMTSEVDELGSDYQLVNKKYVLKNFQRVDAETGLIFVE